MCISCFFFSNFYSGYFTVDQIYIYRTKYFKIFKTNKINIKGFAIGNGCVSENLGVDTLMSFQYAHGMIDDTLVKSHFASFYFYIYVKNEYLRKWNHIKSACCNNDTDSCPFHSFESYDKCGLFVALTLGNAWNIAPSEVHISKNEIDLYNSIYLVQFYVRKALGIPSLVGKWEICREQVTWFLRTSQQSHITFSDRSFSMIASNCYTNYRTMLWTILFSFLTITQSQEIKNLPGVDFDLSFRHFSGFFQVSDTHLLHYW
uniref:Peptidase_S8 domain-containing protein n=1 Tax=Heterorhabditis bacteriophora TaxID=37862 RepID=A0A1I7X2F8_HETBA